MTRHRLLFSKTPQCMFKNTFANIRLSPFLQISYYYRVLYSFGLNDGLSGESTRPGIGALNHDNSAPCLICPCAVPDLQIRQRYDYVSTIVSDLANE